MSEEHGWAIGVVTIVVTIAVCITSFEINKTNKFTENGYEQVTVQGYGVPVWQKVTR